MRGNNSNGLVFLQVPEQLRTQIEEGSEDFFIDPSIPIPVALETGKTTLDLETLSWEMIISGMIHLLINEPDNEHADYYRQFVLNVKSDIFEEFYQVALMKTKNGDYELALEIASALFALFRHNPDVLSDVLSIKAFIFEEQAQSLEKAELEEEAEKAYNAADNAYEALLDLAPNSPDAFFNAGFFFMKRHNFNQAKICFNTYLELSYPDDRRRRKVRAVLDEINKDALEDIDLKEAYNYVKQGDAEIGLERIRNFLERHPHVWNGWFILGWGLRKLGRWEDGAAAFRKTIELGGGNSDTRNELAICLMESGDIAGAKKELLTSLKEEPENVKIISNLGVLSLKSGNKDEAEGFFRTVLELEPNDPLVRTYFSQP